MNKREFRYLPAKELRVATDESGTKKLSGIIPYNQRSADLGGFFEVIAPGAFAKCLGNDILALRDHDSKILLGRTKSKTLRFSDESDGLHYEIDLPNTSQANDLIESVNRGDLDSTSFGFFTIQDDWLNSTDETVRTLIEVDLFEVSPCSFAAYPTSSVSIRSLFPDGAVQPPAKESRAGDCTCECAECIAGSCADCTGDPCECDGCTCNESRSMKMRVRIAASL